MNVSTPTGSLFTAAGFLLALALSACGGGDQGRDPVLGIDAAALVTVAVTPATSNVLVGATQQYTATATYADGSSRNVTSASAWTSAAPLVASVGAASGLATGLTNGSAIVSAAFGGKQGTAAVNVRSLTAILVTPATPTIVQGATQQFVATARYSDASTAVVSNAAWTSGTALVATIDPASGVAIGLLPGQSIITATWSGINGNAVLTVNAPGPLPVPVIPVPPADTVPLGAAGSFAVLAGTALTNNSGGTTLIGGDVGSPSQTTDPTQLPGFVNYKAGPILAAALNDLQVAITNANNRSCTVSSASGIDLGGRVFTPGVYCYAGAISITGTFIMNGPGVYIFRTASTLDSSANSVVAVAGGAAASHVFWLPLGPTTLGANSAFLGSVLGQSAAITVGDNTTLLTGRVLSAAAVTLRNNQISK